MSTGDASANHLLRRLLGPAGAELSCEQCFAHIDRYVDVELLRGRSAADDEVPGMRAHLEGCGACHEEYESLKTLAGQDP
jgi:hypothetical protein